MKKIFENIKIKINSLWFVCRVVPDGKSVKYGLRFSSPLYISLIALGVLLQNPYILFFCALIAILGIFLPMHPFDYIYNGIALLFGFEKIPGRGTEVVVSSTIALLFILIVGSFLLFGVTINYGLLALIYVLSSIIFIGRMF